MGTGRAAEMDKLVSVRIEGKTRAVAHAGCPSTWRRMRSSSQSGLQESLSQKGNKGVVNSSGEASSEMVPRKAILKPEGQSLEQELNEAPGNSFQSPTGNRCSNPSLNVSPCPLPLAFLGASWEPLHICLSPWGQVPCLFE